MGRTGSSSRRKHKKSLKVSYEGYRKKKSRRSKSKKLRHQEESFSSSSDDESTSSSLNTSSSSEGEYRRKRARSRSRKERKGSKKRNRRSLSEDSSDASPVKKRKRSKRSKKIKKKKKSKREYRTSSASSDSGSCSTCKDEDVCSDELGSHGRSRGRSREKKKDLIDSIEDRIGNRKDKRKTRSSISPSRSNGGESIEKVTLENNPVRLKSVITVANVEHEEDDDVTNKELKEETVYDYDDYPSSKSNDSIEFVDRYNISPDKEDVVKVDSGSNLDDNKKKESNISGNNGSEVDNLESILRQKALENLSRFRGGIKTKTVIPVVDKPKSGQLGVKQLKHEETVSMIPASQPVINRSRFTWRRDPTVTMAKDEKAATYSEPHSSGSQPSELKLQSASPSSMSRADNKFVDETSKVMADTSNVGQKSTAAVETPSSASVNEGSSKEQQNESNDNSQFEKKTMSVMRGGEMVQVSYKVYIPNRAPALARRQLKR